MAKRNYSPGNPCPVCGGWAWRKKPRRCRGFRPDRPKEGTFTPGRNGAYCEQENNRRPISPLGFPIYYYKEDELP